MNKNFITPSEAIKALNNGSIVKFDTTDGYIEIQKKRNQFEWRTYINNQDKPTVHSGSIKNVMMTLNRNPFKTGLYL